MVGNVGQESGDVGASGTLRSDLEKHLNMSRDATQIMVL